MKYIIMLMTMLTFVAKASEQCSTETSDAQAVEQLVIKTDVPKYLEGAKITVTLKDGTTSTVPAEKFKVVPRVQQYIVTKTEKNSVTTCNQDPERHRISVLAGKGTMAGLDRNDDNAPNLATVENRVGTVMGAQYQYRTDVKLLSLPLSVGVQGQSNKTGSVLLGVDF